MADKKFGTIRTGKSHKAHVFDHTKCKVLCGVKYKNWPPYKINKTRYDAETMLERHKGFAERRGYSNPYKYTCIACQKQLEKLLNIEHNRV